ncbi:GYDIA family GHMP kinase [Aegicerativicinus sediminis]|uniref:GYDIA family GHMP kinase n=1 Tax=Aegicerativicinus sediminis TaxID=2893202 RepID=UPI001E5A4467|nr:GYDIA family GHMP kinase [Aegicerativicinus sediminis]
MTTSFKANGKLLLTGEYAVLDGALSLALPTKLGQSILIESADIDGINWKSYDHNSEIWFETFINFDELSANTDNIEVDKKARLISIFKEARNLNPSFLVNQTGFKVETFLDFNTNWGLGSSSTLISLISQWADVNPFTLLGKTFGGSGYDIACATANGPITYELKNGKANYSSVKFDPAFKDNLYFVYLNQKQNSRKAIATYRKNKNTIGLTDRISKLTLNILATADFKNFQDLINQHEGFISRALDEEPISTRFPDFKGVLKSLGAWGGDFILAATEEEPYTYFQEKGFNVIIPYHNLIL